MILQDIITLTDAAELMGIPYTTLKVAAQRYARTGGVKGLEARKPKGGRDWITTLAAVTKFREDEYRPHTRSENE